MYQGFYVHDMWEMYSPEGKRHTPWRTDALNPQSVLLGGGCHAIDLILTAASSNPVEVSAYANRLAGSDLPIDDSYVVNIVFEDGVLANVLVTTGANGVSFTPGYFNVYGTGGTIIKDTFYRRGEDPERLGRMSPEVGGGHNWQSAFERFINAVDGLSPDPVPADIAALNVAVCAAATESVKIGRPVKPEIPETHAPWGDHKPTQLMMRYSKSLADLQDWEPRGGFELRRYDRNDDGQIRELMRLVGFEHAAGEYYEAELMPRDERKEGTHVVVHDGGIVGAAFAGREDETAGRIDFVIADPKLSGNGIGYAVCAGVTRHLLENGYENVILMTDDWRLPAVSTYLKLGFEPVFHRDDMEKPWDAVHARLARNWSHAKA